MKFCFVFAVRCGDSVIATEGVMLSPNFPNNYNADDDCEWYLTAKNNGRILVIVHELDTELEHDGFRMREGFAPFSPLITEQSGRGREIILTSTGSYVHFSFISDLSVEAKGMNATWREV